MKTVFHIARNELRQLFYSPIAWILLVLFFIQTGVAYAETFGMLIRYVSLGYSRVDALTYTVFQDDYSGLFTVVQSFLYLYIPLLTMGIMSREKMNGTNKLLLSSPVGDCKVVLGKFVSMMIYGLVMLSCLAIIALVSAVFIVRIDAGPILSGLLGLYLLLLAYSAIGIFMSSLTRYQIVAAVGSIATLFALNYSTRIGQGIPVVREVTYWLGIAGRADTFIQGMICSEDVLYFLAIVALFLSLTVLRMQSETRSRSLRSRFGRYAAVVLLVCAVGYFSSRPALKGYCDTTRMKNCTLTEESRRVMERLDGPLTITTYVNLLGNDYYTALPASYTRDVKRFDWYTRFKPEIRMKYVYYYHDSESNPHDGKAYAGLDVRGKAEKKAKSNRLKMKMFLSPEQIEERIDLSDEDWRFVRIIERGDGRRAKLRIYDDMQRHPGENEITAAMKSLIVPSPRIGILTGHGERSIASQGDSGYFTFARSMSFRYALINQGFEVSEVSIAGGEIPDDIDILLIADPQTAFGAEELAAIERFAARGGNMIVAGKPSRRDRLAPVLEPFGVRFLEGTLVQQSSSYAQNLILGDITQDALATSPGYRHYLREKREVAGVGTMGILADGARAKGFEVYDIITTDSLPTDTTRVWNELQVVDFENHRATFDPASGEELQRSVPIVLGLEREAEGRSQRIVVLGNADMIANGELLMSRAGVNAANYALIMESFRWLSDGEFPIDASREAGPDNALRYLTREAKPWFYWIFTGILPGAIALLGILLLIRRKSR